MKISAAAKVGLLTITSLVILIYGLTWLKGRSISTAERIEVKFHDVDGMRPGSAVQIMGIRVGQVEEIIPVIKDNQSFVRVKFVFTESDMDIPTASAISIQQSGLIGEKFLEITPPKVQTKFLPVNKENNDIDLGAKMLVRLLADGKYIRVGVVKSLEKIDTAKLSLNLRQRITTDYAYKIDYLIDLPGVSVPASSFYDVVRENNEQYLKVTPPNGINIEMPEPNSRFTVKEPMRLKKFLDLQLESAISLKETNDKINELLSEETIESLKITLDNTKNLTAEATKALEQVTALVSASRDDFRKLIVLSSSLSKKVASLTDNVNNLVGDPELKDNLIEMTKSVQQSSKVITALLNDAQLKDTLLYVNNTTKDLSDIMASLNEISKDEEFKTNLSSTLTNLNNTLGKIDNVLGDVEQITGEEEENLKGIIEDSTDISKNLKKFSDKLNKRFLLLRLMF